MKVCILQQQGCINMGVPAGVPDLAQQPEQEPQEGVRIRPYLP